ncbi:MAG: hypothetical protein GY803_08895 [Chloroflexi bacterium]|nr:hypothetical protein [Chloroflexota bacterium]
MTKKRIQSSPEDDLQRQSRKDILRARKETEQTKHIRWAVAGVGGLLLLVLLTALVVEFFIAPNRAVATVNGEEITMSQWEDRVRYERAQRIISLENQYEAFNGDVGIIQQFAQETILGLLDDEALAESVLNQMADETLIRQAAEERGIAIAEADIDKEIGSFFNYFNGESPTPVPEPTETVMPTPSLTPIPTAVITDIVPTNTPFPTLEPAPEGTAAPTATPVSKESFDEELGELLTQFKDLGVDEAAFREAVRMQLYTLALADALAEEQEMPTEEPHASIFYLSFDTEEGANEAAAMMRTSDFLTVWNTIRSQPETSGTASELLWRTQDSIATVLGEEAGEIALTLPPNVPSAVIAQPVNEETIRYHILQVSGIEVRELPDSTIQSQKTELVRALVAEQTESGVELTELWRNRVPTQPVLDPKFLEPPTPTPAVPAAGDGLAPDGQ